MYIDTETMIEEDYFPDTKQFFKTTRKGQLQDQSQNIGLG